MNPQHAHLSISTVFDPTEPVIQSRPLLGRAPVPQFGAIDEWDLNGVIRRPARLPSCASTLVFSEELTEPTWNLLARELTMILLNPRHPAVTNAGLSLKPAPANPSTTISRLSNLRRLARWSHANDLTPHLADWQETDLRRFVGDLRSELSTNSVRIHIGLLRLLHQFGPVLTGGGLRGDPWAGQSVRQAADAWARDTVTTPVIPPEQWFPLIRAAWTYVHTFAPDILRAHQHYQMLLEAATTNVADFDLALRNWLSDPTAPIPIHLNRGRTEPNWSLLTLMLGVERFCTANVFNKTRAGGQRRAALIEHAVSAGHRTTTGVIDDLVAIEHADGIRTTWHAGLDPRAIGHERRMLRNACYLLVVGLSMMRDSEKRAELRLMQHSSTKTMS